MPQVNIIDYKRVGRENLRNLLIRREYNRELNKKIKNHKNGTIILQEVPAENYLEANVSSIKSLLDNGYEGIYMSFQRPYKNLSSLLEQNSVDTDKLLVIDAATSFSGDIQEYNPKCVYVAQDAEVESLVDTIYKSLLKIKGDKKFVFIDSLTTLGLHEATSEISRFPKFLIKTLRENDFEDTTLLFNVAKDLTRKRYITNISVYADEHIHLGLCT